MDGLKAEINHHVHEISTQQRKYIDNAHFYHMTAHDLCAIPSVRDVTRGQTNHSVKKKKKKEEIKKKLRRKTERHRMVNSAVISINAVIKVRAHARAHTTRTRRGSTKRRVNSVS